MNESEESEESDESDESELGCFLKNFLKNLQVQIRCPNSVIFASLRIREIKRHVLLRKIHIVSLPTYRPISLLPQFSKILEKLIAVRLVSYLEKEDILVSEQFGFRKGINTAHALHTMVENISHALEKKLNVIGIFVDLKKAFDTVNHALLLKKLQHYGIRGKAYDLFKSYLSSRKQYVSIRNTDSQYLYVSYGVPQGSILGPLLFLIYVNDICKCSAVLKFVLFADDTNIFFSSSNLDTFEDTVNQELALLSKWFNTNKLSLNVQKTSYMLFQKRTSSFNPVIKINETVLQCVTSTKFLGVQLDNKMLWKDHITYVRGKLSSVLSVLYRVRSLVDSKSLILLYNTLFVPHMYYCCSIWGNTCKTFLKSITSVQKRAVYILDPNLSRTNEIFAKYKLLKFVDIVYICTALVAYDAHKNSLPATLRSLYKPMNTNCNSINYNRFISICAKSNIRYNCITAASIRIWNSLSDSLRTQTHKFRFKNLLKQKANTLYV